MSLRLFVNVSGTDLSKYAEIEGFQVTQAVTKKGDTCNIRIQDWTKQLRILPMSPITVTNEKGNIVFGGLVTRPRGYTKDSGSNWWELQGQDWTYFLQTTLLQKKYYNQPIDVIVTDMLKTFPCGITTHNVQPGGPVIPYFGADHMPLATALNRLCKHSLGGLVYNWFVDYNRDLHFYNQYAAPQADIYLTDTPYYLATNLGGLPPASYLADTFYYEDDGTQIRNSVIMRGGQFLSNLFTDSWFGDGTRVSFPFTYSPDIDQGGLPTVTVNGASQTVGADPGQTAATTQWFTRQLNDGSWTLVAGTAGSPAVNVPVQAAYFWDQPVLVKVKNTSSINYYRTAAEYNGGVYERFVKDTSIITQAAAKARAQAELQQYALHTRRAHADVNATYSGAMSAGQQVRLQNGQLGVDQTFIIVQNIIQGNSDSTWNYQLDLQSVGSA